MAHETPEQERSREAREEQAEAERQATKSYPHTSRAHETPAQEAAREAREERAEALAEGRRPTPKDGPFVLVQKGSVVPRSTKLPKIGEAPEELRKVTIPRGGSATFIASAGLSSGLVGAYSLSVPGPTSHVTVSVLPTSTVVVGKESTPFTLSVADGAPLGDAVVTIEANDGDRMRSAKIHVTVVE